MAKQIVLAAFLVALSLSCVLAFRETTLCVIDSSANISEHCNNSVQCHSKNIINLTDVGPRSENYLEVNIILCSAEYTVPMSMNSTEFYNKISVSISSVGDIASSQLNCQNEGYGLVFRTISRISIKGISVTGCFFKIDATKEHYRTDYLLPVAIYIVNSTNITISDVSIQDTTGVGLLLSNSSKYVNIISSNFTNNSGPGGGVSIVSYSSQLSIYYIKDCTFENNNNNALTDSKSQQWDEIDRGGGGISAYFRSNKSMSVVNCVFESNRARYGGALYLYFEDSAENVTVTVEKSHFESNSASESGGALAAGFVSSNVTIQNRILFSSCNFNSNEAEIGGGTYLFATAPVYHNNITLKDRDNFTFFDCVWTKNKALYGSAIFISPYIFQNHIKFSNLVIPVFHNCKFHQNEYNENNVNVSNGIFSVHSSGTVFISTFHIQLKGEVSFTDNDNSALHLYSSILEISAGSQVRFEGNTGYHGGAIHMKGHSSIYLNDNTYIVFDSNKAIDKGGAIYHVALVDPSNLTSYNCFMRYVGDYNDIADINKRNINVEFINNTALNGTSIFLFSTLPCCTTYNNENISKYLRNTANFTFDNNNENTIATLASNFSIQGTLPSELIPGIEERLNITVVDDLKAEVPLVYKARVIPFSDKIAVDPGYTIVTDGKIKLSGDIGSNGTVRLNLIQQPYTSFSFNITLKSCPPGFVYDKEAKRCDCSANFDDRYYLGIRKCDHNSNRAKLFLGYWAGYVQRNGSVFRTSNCPPDYCRKTSESEISLPHSEEELSDLICSEHRQGVICSECETGTSVFFQSNDCTADNKSCIFGIVIYILSQLLPVTVMFLIIVLFDVQLTTGALNGFLLYMQMFDTLTVSAYNFITFPVRTKSLLSILQFIVSVFNLKFFANLHFCLYKGANSLDILAFDYVIVAYSLFLIIFTVIIMNLRCNKISRLLQRLKGKNLHISQSIVHGLSGFLVMCYARATITSLQILGPAWLYDEGASRDVKDVRVFYYGKMTYLNGQHLKYAIPAMFSLIIVTLLPPLLLLTYPLCYKVLALLRIQESKFTKLLCRVLPLEKFKPFFDSFQGTFKDNHRYFSGLYFVYRLVALLLFAAQSHLADFYFYLEIQLIVMLVLHAWVRPYKENKHNRLDLFIFTLLLVLNRITSYNYQWTLNPRDLHDTVPIFSTIQVLLAFTPLLVMTVLVLVTLRIKALLKYLREKIGKQKRADEGNLTLSMIDEGRDIGYNVLN